MFDAIENNLNVGVALVRTISDEQYRDNSIKPYHSSIGSHIRHILDIFDCIFCGLDKKAVDLTARSRNLIVEQERAVGLEYFEQILAKLQTIKDMDLDQIIDVSDDLGTGMICCKYTLGSLLVQAHSHAMHHFASLGYIISQLGLQLPNADFGYNPTTPEENRVN